LLVGVDDAREDFGKILGNRLDVLGCELGDFRRGSLK
jgi:hypothetical protein